MKILVTGATGYIGGHLVPRLLQAGHTVRCLVRTPEKLAEKNWQCVEIERGDLQTGDGLNEALVGMDAAYYLVHSMYGGEKGFEERDRISARNFAAVAQRAGLKRILYLGGLGGEGPNLSHHLQSRHEVGDILRASEIPVTEFRAAIIVGTGSVSFKIVSYLAERLPVMICPRWLNSRCQPIGIEDVLDYLVQALNNPRSAGETLEIGGADILTYGDMISRYAKVRGLKRWLIKVPVLTPRLSSYWINFVTPIPAAIVRPLVEGLRNDVVVTDRKALEIFPIRPQGYEEAVRAALKSHSTLDSSNEI